MQFILVPGFWLGAESWSNVGTALDDLGVRHVALTLPGLEPGALDASKVRLTQHIDAVSRAIEMSSEKVVLVGHSGAGPICHAAAADQSSKVARVVHVDTWPLGAGLAINAELAGDLGVIPLPDWSAFEPEDLVDMTEPAQQRLIAEARPQPAAIAREKFPAMDADRLNIPTTIICCEFTSTQIRAWISSGEERLAELRRLRRVSYVDLPTGHWPQFTKPRELARLLAELA